MPTTRPPMSLAALLAVDAATCAGMGALLALGAGPISTLTALPAPFLVSAGIVLLPVAAFMAVFARARRVPGWAVLVVVAGNLAWVAASLALPLSGAVAPNALGWSALAAQAMVVAGLAGLEWSAARRAATA